MVFNMEIKINIIELKLSLESSEVNAVYGMWLCNLKKDNILIISVYHNYINIVVYIYI